MRLDIKKLTLIKEYGAKLNILYVEDNEEARSATLDVLEEFFQNIEVAVDGEEGLLKFESTKYDLIITDINMPKMDGISMLKKIRKKDTQVPVLIISAYNESGYFMETIRLDVEGYILKPIELEQFIQILSKVVDKIKLRQENQQYQKELEKKVQEQLELLRNKEKILLEREKFASLGEMIDAIAHQFRQPLGIMRLQNEELEYLLKEELKLSSEEIETALKRSSIQVNHLLETIEEFRHFFREDVEIENVSLKKIFKSVLTLLKDELIKNTTQVQIECPDDLMVNIVPNEFKHVFINLINNAIDEFKKNNINERNILIKAYKKDKETFIEVQDNAGGIPDNIICHIFEPNFTTKDSQKGTGIGLHISKIILEKIDASIFAFNKDNGAVFTIKLSK